MNFFIIREVFKLKEPIDHVIMAFFENSIIIDILHDLLWLNVLHDPLLLLYEVVK